MAKRIDLLGERFDVVDSATGEATVIRWTDVEAIAAFKRDFWSYDVICVTFQLADGRNVEVDEEMGGFLPLMDEAPKKCAGCVPCDQWYSAIMVPAFVTNLTELYRRLPDTPHAASELDRTLDYRGPH